MKQLHVMTLGAVLTLLAGSALADGHVSPASKPVPLPVNIEACTPPTDAPQCAEFHRALRARFSNRELGMLFGHQSSYPESLTGGVERLRHRYEAAVQQYKLAQQAAGAVDVAGK